MLKPLALYSALEQLSNWLVRSDAGGPSQSQLVFPPPAPKTEHRGTCVSYARYAVYKGETGYNSRRVKLAWRVSSFGRLLVATQELVGQKLGQYEILELIGEGGMARVYRALQPTLEREVAIKALSTEIDDVRDQDLRRRCDG